jgi:predicted lipid-binding transport protein (Tim44 family)
MIHRRDARAASARTAPATHAFDDECRGANMSDIGDMMGRYLAGVMLALIVGSAVGGIVLFETALWLWHHLAIHVAVQ